MPDRFKVETGFIVTPTGESSQIDILVIDGDKPVVLRDASGVVYVTPDAVKAIVEVKTSLGGEREYLRELAKIASNVGLCKPHGVWSGLFIFESRVSVDSWHGPDDTLLSAADEATDGDPEVRIQCISYGTDVFVRYWPDSQAAAGGVIHGPAWHSYRMPGLAPAYFVGNLVDAVVSLPDEYSKVWFPIPDGKETLRRWYLAPRQLPEMFPDFRCSLEKDGGRDVLSRLDSRR